MPEPVNQSRGAIEARLYMARRALEYLYAQAHDDMPVSDQLKIMLLHSEIAELEESLA